MWYTTRFEGYDDPKHSNRGPSGVATLQGVLSASLRTGFFLEVVGITGLVLTYYACKGTGLFTYDLSQSSEEQRQMPSFRLCLVIFSGLHLIGSLHIMIFQAALADDASCARGYRAGAKLLGIATFFDLVASTLQFIIYAYMLTNYDQIWWSQFVSGGVEWLIVALARLVHAFAMFYFSSALLLLEVYHDNGTNDWHGVLNCFLFFVGGCAEIVALTISNSTVSVVITWIALVSAMVWSMAFEQEVNASAPLLNEPELTNEIEAQVEKFARKTPYLSGQD